MSDVDDLIPMLREFVERNSNIVDLQFDPNIPPKLLFDPRSEDYESRRRSAHYFLLVASIDESRVIGRAENARCLVVELHKEFGDNLFEISELKMFTDEVVHSRLYREFGPLKRQIPSLLTSVNTFVRERALGDLIKHSKRLDGAEGMVQDISKCVRRMGGPIKKKAWLYLRWMVRPKPDLRIFDHFSPNQLFIPLTKDIKKVAASLSLIDKKRVSGWETWGDVEKVTKFCRKLFPSDPAKCDYPFFLVGRWLEGKELTRENLMRTLVTFDKFYKKTKYSILLRKERRGYSAECPALRGCITQGETEEETLGNMEEAIFCYLEGAKKDYNETKKDFGEG